MPDDDICYLGDSRRRAAVGPTFLISTRGSAMVDDLPLEAISECKLRLAIREGNQKRGGRGEALAVRLPSLPVFGSMVRVVTIGVTYSEPNVPLPCGVYASPPVVNSLRAPRTVFRDAW